MGETDLIIRSMGKLHGRLFDHRPAVGAELRQFVEEFEARSTRRIRGRNLDASLTLARDAAERQLPDAELLLNDQAPRIVASVEVATRMVDRIVERRKSSELSEQMEKLRQQRTKAWAIYMESVENESQDIEADYEEGRKKIAVFYEELEKNLN